MFRDAQVILFSVDVARAARFYRSLGFTETFRTPADGDPIHVDLRLGDHTIGVASVASTRDDHGLHPLSEGQRAAVVLWTNDATAAWTSLVEAGAPALAAPREWLGRLLIAWTADPDGHPLQIVQSLR